MKLLRYLTALALYRVHDWTNSLSAKLATAALRTAGLKPVMGGMGNLVSPGPNFFGGAGVPAAISDSNNTAPAVGDYYFRTGAPGAAGTRIYVCTVGGLTPTWVATAA
jgi:phage-related minor tail protein